jgi:hypothetical protein
VPTPNCDVIYSLSYLDLKEAGPLVVYAPPHVIGMFTDFYQRTLKDRHAQFFCPDEEDGCCAPDPGWYMSESSSLPRGRGGQEILSRYIRSCHEGYR